MTAKRFKIDKNGGAYYLFDNGNLIPISDGQPICDLLNKLADENEQLKVDKQHLHQAMSREEIRHKQFKDKVFDLIDAKIKELSTTIEYGDVHEDLRIFAQQVLLDLKKELVND